MELEGNNVDNNSNLSGRGRGSGVVNDEEREQEMLTNAVKKVRSEWRDMVKRAYLDHASEIM